MKEDLSDWNEKERLLFQMKIQFFENYLVNQKFNNAYNYAEHSMDHPTTDYFVYSSHNTYLKGHQLYGNSLS